MYREKTITKKKDFDKFGNLKFGFDICSSLQSPKMTEQVENTLKNIDLNTPTIEA